MAMVIAVIVLPIVFVIVATSVVLRVTLAMARVIFGTALMLARLARASS